MSGKIRLEDSGDNPVLSIYIATYNHKDYILKALESVAAQKTKYSFEVLVGDDCSTDGTSDIIRQFEKEHPGLLTVFYREKNMYFDPVGNAEDLVNRARGKYIIALEGDDYWLDENKIEEQIEFLETHPEYIAVSHNCVVVDENNEPNGEEYPECKEEEYTLKHFGKLIFPGQLATFMYRNFKNYDIGVDDSILEDLWGPEDKATYFMLILHGKIRCIQKKMSAYRHVVNKGESFSAKLEVTGIPFEQYEWYNRQFVEYAHRLNHKEASIISEMNYFGAIFPEYRRKKITKEEYLECKKRMNYPMRAMFRYAMRGVGHVINRQKV